MEIKKGMILFGTTETKSCEVGGVFAYGEIVALNASGKAVRYVPSTDGQVPIGVAYRNVYSSLSDVKVGDTVPILLRGYVVMEAATGASLTGKFHYASGKVTGTSGTIDRVATAELIGINAFQKLGSNFVGVALSGAINVK